MRKIELIRTHVTILFEEDNLLWHFCFNKWGVGSAGLEPGLNCLIQERKGAIVPLFPKSLSQAQSKYGTNLESGFEGRAVTSLLGFSTCLPPVLPAP